MGLAVTLLQESFSKGKGGHPGRMDAQSSQFSPQGLRVCTWAAEVTCWTDRSRQSDGQTSLLTQAKTKATCMLGHIICRSQHTFSFVLMLDGVVLSPVSKQSCLLHCPWLTPWEPGLFPFAKWKQIASVLPSS